MASTYTPQQAIDLVTQFAHGVPLTGSEANICDMINSMIWTYYPWSWSVASFTPVNLVDGTQDYVVSNTDVLRPLRFKLTRTDITPNEIRELALLANLPVELTRKGGLDTNTSASWFASTSTVRLMLAAGVGTGQVIQIGGDYQKVPTRITDATMSTPFAFSDYYFNVFVEGIKWKIYQLIDDPRAGTLQISKNGTFQQVFNGQLGVFMNQLNYMARTEDLSAGDQFQFPESALGVGRSYWPGLFGM